MSTEFINLSEIYLPTAGGSIDGDVEVGGAIKVNDGTGAGTTYDLAYEISQLRAENEELKAAWDSVSPYRIVEQGTSGNWHYWKYEDGTAICTGQITYSNITYSSSYGYGYYNETGSIAFPFTFTERPRVIGTVWAGTGLMSCSISALTTSSVNFYLFCTANITNTPDIFIYAEGYWK